MRKKRISSNVSRKLSVEAAQKAKELNISTSRLVEIALESELGHFNIHKENKRLTEARINAEQETEEARKQRDTFKAKSEEALSNFETCREKLTLLLTRNWWQRLWNIVPWE